MTMDRRLGKCTAAVLYFICIGFCYPILALEIIEEKRGELGETANISCTSETTSILWYFQGELIKMGERITEEMIESTVNETDLDGGHKKTNISTITITNLTVDDAGNYTCEPKGGGKNKTFLLNLSFPAKLVRNHTTLGPIRENASDKANVTLSCVFEVYKLGEVRWYKKGIEEDTNITVPEPKHINAKQIQTDYTLAIHGPDDNGTYVCEVFDYETSTNDSASIDVFIYAPPKILIADVIAISPTEMYVNWTVWTYNAPKVNYTLKTRALPEKHSTVTSHPKLNSELNTSYVINNLKKLTTYEVGIEVATGLGTHFNVYGKHVTTLETEPTFIPQISINGFSATSVTIGWDAPSSEIEKFIHYYYLEARKKDETNSSRETVQMKESSRNLPYMFGNLEPHTTYVFKVCACSEYTHKCGNWSQEMEAATLDGKPGVPADVTSYCDVHFMTLTWNQPKQPNAEIKGYIMELTGYAKYKDRYGIEKEDIWGPLSKFMTNNSRSVRFDELQANTLYSVRLSAMTRTRRRGDEVLRNCTTRPAPPDSPPRPRWRKFLDKDKYRFKLYLPRVSERNGPICCYRVYMVHLPSNLQPPLTKNIEVFDYEKAHAHNGPAAYITDVFTNENFPSESELIMGDGKSVFDRNIPRLKSEACGKCLKRPMRAQSQLVGTTSTSTSPEPTPDDLYDEEEDITMDPPVSRVKRYFQNDFSNDRMMMDTVSNILEDKDIKPEDGPLDPNSNYTLFIELIPDVIDYEEPLYSDYVNALMPAASPPIAVPSTTLELALQVTCAVAALVLLGMVVFCVLHARRSRKLHHPHHAHHAHAHEMSTLQTVFKYVTGRGKQQMVSAVPPDLPPIPKDDLADAYAERQADSDYGFQKEFELLQMLPECYPDRTTHASEARENQPKNRYPDIKAYDQTRVKLSQIDSITGSDYINANYVRGYTDPKKFICAQGPTDTTVNDFWRMIWEHGLELIVMLTNLEEYSKVKCSKYWPDEVRGARAFGTITVHHVSEKRYSDYIVRELKITKQATNAEGQPIVENNGIAKRNGDCKEPSESSAPTSPRELKESNETRTVRQYHFLMWKDFAAPEHPYSILKFIKRVNEACCNMMGRPVVVHCSAGVGRTGTLVALDCLLDQLAATGHAAVFNTVAELRRQRNFLVQSLKQYVFVYRALVEWCHYGDTEVPASRLKALVDRLRNTPEGADKCLMDHQFDKILNSPVAEPLKSCAAGAGDELRSRNRSSDCLPYDRNRVILTPIPGRDYSTYINASFIEAYDNSEGFIITQDPLPNTIMDFWRMVAEHNVSTIVMLSELGDGKCPRYWEDNTAQYEHIGVQYEESESCPYYTRRQFRVTNNKSGEVVCVRQLQYQGWPTAPGHVPEVTRGLAELADAALPHYTAAHSANHGVMLVHCQLGTERSSLFVALCVLISQLRVERRVDVCCVTRKVRSQRARTIDTFLQYEFLHRAILNYAELHNLLEDS